MDSKQKKNLTNKEMIVNAITIEIEQYGMKF